MARPAIVLTALKVSFVVGTLLNAINQGEALWAGHTIIWWRVALNYVVPYCVSSYSAARNEARRVKSD
ncbi:MAG: nitrate/nitrite transporter NrtS [Caldimonas sp.]